VGLGHLNTGILGSYHTRSLDVCPRLASCSEKTRTSQSKLCFDKGSFQPSEKPVFPSVRKAKFKTMILMNLHLLSLPTEVCEFNERELTGVCS
jgi:hypothetical protein